jgi:hypothetical protein
MANPQRYTWPVSSTTSVAALQTLSGAGKLKLNGSLDPLGTLPLDMGRITRQLNFTSVNNLGAVNITIVGTNFGFPATEVLVGPNADTVTSVNYYTTISSISVNAAVTGLSVGSDLLGYTNWFRFDYQASVANTAIQVVVGGTITYSLQITCDDANKVQAPTTFTPVVAMTAATTSQLADYTAPYTYARIAITSSDGTGTLVATFIQQGLHS